jgi:hypothetical protein
LGTKSFGGLRRALQMKEGAEEKEEKKEEPIPVKKV